MIQAFINGMGFGAALIACMWLHVLSLWVYDNHIKWWLMDYAKWRQKLRANRRSWTSEQRKAFARLLWMLVLLIIILALITVPFGFMVWDFYFDFDKASK